MRAICPRCHPGAPIELQARNVTVEFCAEHHLDVFGHPEPGDREFCFLHGYDCPDDTTQLELFR